MYNKEILAQWREDIFKRNQAISAIVEMQSTVARMRRDGIAETHVKKVLNSGIAEVSSIMPDVPITWKGEDGPKVSELEELARLEVLEASSL